MQPAPATSQDSAAPQQQTIRHNWTRQEIRAIYDLPLTELLFRAQSTHRAHHKPDEIQLCRLLSIKTGGCPEDCGYCPQSAHYTAGVPRENLMNVPDVLAAARRAKSDGATRFCMGAAWRDAPEGPEFQSVLEMVSGVAAMQLEVCCTLGMLTNDQARDLKGAGLTAYNHNLDTSPEFYGEIIHTRTYEERLKTLAAVREAGITVCSGGIVGMGESDDDRVGLLQQLAQLNPHPESVPINMLVRAEGTPLANQPDLDPLIMVRMIATARIVMPKSRVRLAAGRLQLSREAATLCFVAGANSIFTGEKLLTTPNPQPSEDESLLRDLGLRNVPLASPPAPTTTHFATSNDPRRTTQQQS
jgi:biotin synthase